MNVKLLLLGLTILGASVIYMTSCSTLAPQPKPSQQICNC